MRWRIAVVLTIAVVCCQALLAFAQAQAPMGKQKGKVGPGFETPWGKKSSPFSSRMVEEAQTPAPAFLVTLEERAKERQVFLRYIEGAVPNRVAADGPGVVTIQAIRRIQGEEPPKTYLYISAVRREMPEEDVRKIVQFKKDFGKKVAPIAEHVQTANLTLNSHGLVLNFNLKTGECQWDHTYQVPDGFFDALSDALADLEKLKTGKPAFQVK